MAVGKMSPRQKMINMMYLVLLALLALNVSKEVLKAFHLMEVSFENTSKSHHQKMDATLSGLESIKKDNPKKVAFFQERALKAKKMAQELNEYLYDVQLKVESNGGGRMETDELGVGKPELKNGDDLETHANFFAAAEANGQGNGTLVRQRVEQTRKRMLALLKSDSKDTLYQIDGSHFTELSYSPDLRINDVVNAEGITKKWEDMFLIETPLAAVVTNLARLRNETLNLANSVISKLAKEAGASAFKFDDMKAFVNPKSNYVMAGSKYEADILLVAASSQSNYKIKIGNDFLPLSEGIGKYVSAARGVGNHKLNGEIIMPGKNPIPFETEWTSFMPSATVSPVNMNVLYIGLNNPIEVSVPGIDPSNVIVSMNNGSIAKQNGTKFIAKVASGKKAMVNVKARMPDGSVKGMGNMEFRVRTVPDPTVTFGALGSGAYSASEINRQRNIQLFLKDFFFKGVRYEMISYQMSIRDKDGRIKYNNYNIAGSRINVPRIKRGDIIVVGKVKARKPGGGVKMLRNQIIIKAN